MIVMALRDSASGRQYDSYVNTSAGTAVRVSTVAGGSVASNLVSASGTANISGTQGVLIQKQTLNGKTGSWFVYNAGGTDIEVNMYSAYASGAADYSVDHAQWDQVGSTQTVAATTTKHIPFNNVYRFVALAASTSTGTSLGVSAVLYAL